LEKKENWLADMTKNKDDRRYGKNLDVMETLNA